MRDFALKNTCESQRSYCGYFFYSLELSHKKILSNKKSGVILLFPSGGEVHVKGLLSREQNAVTEYEHEIPETLEDVEIRSGTSARSRGKSLDAIM